MGPPGSFKEATHHAPPLLHSPMLIIRPVDAELDEEQCTAWGLQAVEEAVDSVGAGVA